MVQEAIIAVAYFIEFEKIIEISIPQVMLRLQVNFFFQNFQLIVFNQIFEAEFRGLIFKKSKVNVKFAILF